MPGITRLLQNQKPTVTQSAGVYNSRHVTLANSVTASLIPGDFTAGGGTLLSNYILPVSANGAGAITARPIIVTATAGSRVYDGTTASAVAPTVTSGSIAAGDNASFVQTYNNRNAGSGKTLTPTGSVNDGNGGANYAVTLTPAAVGVITPAPLTVAAVAGVKTYDGTTASAGIPLIMSGSLFGTDTATFTQAFANANAGSSKSLIPNAIIADGIGGNNYAVTLQNNNTGVINARPIVVTPTSGLAKTYGNNEPAFTYAVTSGNLVGADTLSGALARVAGEDAGNYAITQGLLGNSNYALTLAPANFAIQPRAISVSADNNTKVYGATDPVLTFTVGGSGLAARDTLTTAFSGALTRAPGENVAGGPNGAYAITQGSLASSANYVMAFINGRFVVTPVPLTVRANDASRDAAAPNPAFSASYLGFVFGETPTVLGGALNFFTPAAATSPEGRYVITPSGLSSTNYALRYVDGVLDVRPAAKAYSHEALFAASQQSIAVGGGASDTGSNAVVGGRVLGGECRLISDLFFDCRATSRGAGR